MTKKQKKMLQRILIAAALLVILHFVPATGLLKLAPEKCAKQLLTSTEPMHIMNI